MYVTIKKVSLVMNEMEVELTHNEITEVHEEYKGQLKKFGKYTSEIWKEVLEEIITETLQKRPQLV